MDTMYNYAECKLIRNSKIVKNLTKKTYLFSIIAYDFLHFHCTIIIVCKAMELNFVFLISIIRKFCSNVKKFATIFILLNSLFIYVI